MRQNSNNVQPPGSEQTQWFLQGNQNNTGGAAGSGGSKQYSSYGDYDGALDQRTNQIYNESHEKNYISWRSQKNMKLLEFHARITKS